MSPCNTLQHTATHYNTLQHTATHCNTLQHTATHCNTHLSPNKRRNGTNCRANHRQRHTHRLQHHPPEQCVCVCVCVCERERERACVLCSRIPTLSHTLTLSPSLTHTHALSLSHHRQCDIRWGCARMMACMSHTHTHTLSPSLTTGSAIDIASSKTQSNLT